MTTTPLATCLQKSLRVAKSRYKSLQATQPTMPVKMVDGNSNVEFDILNLF